MVNPRGLEYDISARPLIGPEARLMTILDPLTGQTIVLDTTGKPRG